MKLTAELIEAYLDRRLAKAEAAKLELWLKGHPADAATVQRQEDLRQALAASVPGPSAAQSKKMWAAIRAQVQAEAAPTPVLDLREPWYAFLFKPWVGAMTVGLTTAVLAVLALVWRPWAGVPMQAPDAPRAEAPASAPVLAQADSVKTAEPMKEKAAAPSANVEEKKSAKPSSGGASLASVGAGAPSADRDDERSAAVTKSLSSASAKASRSDAADRAATPAAMAQPSAATALVFAPATKAKAEAPTEVERALADSGVDGMIDAYLAAQRNGNGPAMARRPSFSQDSLSSPLAGLSNTSAAPEAESLDSQQLGAVLGGIDQNGFWNWRPAAIALNKRDWSQARLELEAARDRASESTERAFAGSALTLLGAPGAPLAGQTEILPGVGELRVLGAGRWQLMVDSRLARFSEGVSARLPGFRAQGDSLLLDLTFDRGSFAAGTRFTRLAGEKPAEVLDAQGRPVVADEFSAPAGATYNVSGQKLNLR